MNDVNDWNIYNQVIEIFKYKAIQWLWNAILCHNKVKKLRHLKKDCWKNGSLACGQSG